MILMTQLVSAEQLPLGKLSCVVTELRTIEIIEGKINEGRQSSHDHRRKGDRYHIEYGIESNKKTIYLKNGESVINDFIARKITNLAPSEILLHHKFGAHMGEFKLERSKLEVVYPFNNRTLKLKQYGENNSLKAVHFSGTEVKNNMNKLEYRVLDCSLVEDGYMTLWNYTE